jgi:hypothetical protein
MNEQSIKKTKSKWLAAILIVALLATVGAAIGMGGGGKNTLLACR